MISAEIFSPAAAERRRKQDSSRADVIESSEESRIFFVFFLVTAVVAPQKVNVVNLAPAHFLLEGLLKAKKRKRNKLETLRQMEKKVFFSILSVSNTLSPCFSSSVLAAVCSPAPCCCARGLSGKSPQASKNSPIYLFNIRPVRRSLPKEEFKLRPGMHI